jgi:diguanylate cyclase (GGDEF)-like protein/PAS domain S-box-containing protein
VVDALYALNAISNRSNPGVADIQDACALIASTVGASDAYVLRAGDPDFVRIGCPCSPRDYEIKQRGYWTVWRPLASDSTILLGAFDVAERIARWGGRMQLGRPTTHIATILPGDESNSELLVLRGPWPGGLDDAHMRFLVVARTIVAHLVNNFLDLDRRARQKDQLESLANVSRAFSEAREAEHILTDVATALAKASGFDWVTVVTYNDACDAINDRAMNRARYSETETASRFQGPRATASTSETRLGVELARTGGAILIKDVFEPGLANRVDVALIREDIPGLQHYWTRAHVLSMAIFPLVFQGASLGFATFNSSTAREFGTTEVEFLLALVAQASTAIKGLRLYRDLEQSREDLRQSERRFRSLVQNASDLITVMSEDTTILYQSPSVTPALAYDSLSITGTRLIDLVHPEDQATLVSFTREAMRAPQAVSSVEARLRHLDGSWRHLQIVGSDRRADPGIEGFVLNMRDVTERKELEDQLRWQALHDPLTQLPNRTCLRLRLAQALQHKTSGWTEFAVLFVDLDNFKSVNDKLGHAAGDQLLIEVSRCLEACVRQGDTVARLGGDEFAIVLGETTSAEAAAATARRILYLLRSPITVDGIALLVSASIGIALAGADCVDADELLCDADAAMYTAKARGKGRYEVFSERAQRDLELVEGQEQAYSVHEDLVKTPALIDVVPGAEFEWSRRDSLTGLWSHAAIVDLLEREILRRGAGDISLVIVDVDAMTEINGAFGHESGDRVLHATAHALSRDGALVGRYAGDRFLALLAGTNRAGAHAYVANVERAASETKLIDASSRTPIPFTLSFGIAVCPGEAGDADELVRLAERAMYASKSRLAMRSGDAARRLADRVRSLTDDLVPLLTSPAPLSDKIRLVAERLSDGLGYDAVECTLFRQQGEGLLASCALIDGIVTPSVQTWTEELERDLKREETELRVVLAATQRPILIDDIAAEERITETKRRLMAQMGLRSVLVVPMTWNGELIGELGLGRRKKAGFSPGDAQFLAAVARQVAAMVRMAALVEGLQTASARLETAQAETVLMLAAAAEAHDHATGQHLHNIRALAEALARELG